LSQRCWLRFQHVRVGPTDRVAWFWLKQKDFTRTGAESDDTEGFD